MISRDETRWLWRFAWIVLTVTTIPYLLGFFLQGDLWRFSGFVFGVEDGNSYIAKMLWGAAGEWLFRTPYTAFDQNGFFAFIPYILLGKITSPPGLHEQLLALFQLFRWASGFCMIWASYRFLAFFVEDIPLRRMGVVLIALGGGLGWLSITGLQGLWSKGLPLEFYSPETFGFLSLLGLPHLALGRALLLWGLVSFFEAARSEKIDLRYLLKPGGYWFLLGLMQPLTIITGWAILACYLLLVTLREVYRHFAHTGADWVGWRKQVKLGAVTALVSSPIVVYTQVSFSVDPFLREWAGQNLILSPPVVDYLWAFALIIPFAVIGLKKIMITCSPFVFFFTGWVALFPILAYAPYNLQRRLPDGIWVVLVSLGMIGLAQIKSTTWRKLGKIWLYSGMISTLVVLLGSLFTVLQVREPLYRPKAETDAFLFIQSRIQKDSVVMAAYDTSNALPTWAPVRTLIGHGPESMRLREVQPHVEKFLANSLDIELSNALIDKFSVNLILLTPEERNFTVPIEMSRIEFSEIYNANGYRIIEINRWKK